MAARILAKVEVKFDGTNYNDISAYTRRVTINYGRAHLLEDDFQAGSCSIELDNTGGEFTPGHPGASYGDSQLINREVRISTEVVGGSDSYATYLWRGRIADVDYIAQQSTSTVYLRTVDGFDKLAKAQILSQAFSAQYTGLRIANVLDLASVDYPDESSPDDRDIDLGFVYLTAASGVTSTALDYLQKIARSEGGRFLVNHAGAPSATNFGGVLQFYARNASTDDMGITVSDAVTLGAGSVEAAGLNLEWGSELLFNSFQWTDSAGGVQTGSNAASITKYGERVSKKTLLSDASTTDESGDYFIGLFDEPALRPSQVVVQIDAAPPADAEKLLHLHVNSAIDLSYLPTGSSTTLSGAYVIEGVTLDIGVRDMSTNAASIRATYSTSTADTTGYWVLDDPALSVFPTLLAPSWVDTSSWRLDDPDRGVLPTQLG
jgi:hypothetical protein|tara:strand:- start:813 stop:2114 length:1302 start_codon:yes stop_codon:yes gene_type:complete